MVTEKERAAALDPDMLTRLDITDVDSGLRLVWDGGKVALASGQDVYLIHVAAAGLLARAQGFHGGSVAAIEADNPYAPFTLLRPYAENAVALIYLRDKPAALAKFVNNPNPPGGTVVSVQRTPVAVLVATGGSGRRNGIRRQGLGRSAQRTQCRCEFVGHNIRDPPRDWVAHVAFR